MKRNPNDEPFVAPSADPSLLNRKKVLAGKGLIILLGCIACFIFLVWLFIGFVAAFHSLGLTDCAIHDSCV
jgi:hypothetical protein